MVPRLPPTAPPPRRVTCVLVAASVSFVTFHGQALSQAPHIHDYITLEVSTVIPAFLPSGETEHREEKGFGHSHRSERVGEQREEPGSWLAWLPTPGREKAVWASEPRRPGLGYRVGYLPWLCGDQQVTEPL